MSGVTVSVERGVYSEALSLKVIAFFGHLHTLLKSPAKMAEFHRSLQKRLEFLRRRQVDVKNR